MAALRSSITPNIARCMRRIRLAAFDIDGVMSDGTLAYADDGSEAKGFNSLDGQGLKLLQQAGIAVAIVSARTSPVVARRAQELAIEHLVQGSNDKLQALGALAQRLGVALAQCAYMGDDLADAKALQSCGFACSVAQAPLRIREQAHYVTRRPGGEGAVREICDLLLRARRVAPPGN
jgi:3-deoxy-D-manno-octulosonate 8-phosphate phosphatase (KDO 8-P phosphatase)